MASSTLTKTSLPRSRQARLKFINANPALKKRYDDLRDDKAREAALTQDDDGFKSVVKYWSGNNSNFEALMAHHDREYNRTYGDK